MHVTVTDDDNDSGGGGGGDDTFRVLLTFCPRY
jgi:hypothetical protein